MEAHEDLSTGLGRLGRENSPLRAKCDIGTPDVTSLDLISNLNKSNEVETKSPHPDYVQTLKVKDANGQIKELIFPKGLDLDRPKRARTTFTGDQLATLEKEFRRNQYLVGRERSLLASRLGLSETQVKVWYQNRRTKHKRDREREVETSSLPCVTPSFSSSTSTSSSYFPFQPSSLPPSVVAFPDSSSSSSTPSSTTKNQVTSKEGNIDVSWTTIGPSPLVNAHLHSNGSIESSSKCLKSSLPSDEGREKNLGSPRDDGTPKYPYRNHPYYPHCATSSSVDKLETLENNGTKPFESPIPPLENLMYSPPEHPHPLSALFGTFHSVSPTLPHSAFRPLASRPTHQNPFYYLKPAGYPSWLP